MRGAVLTDDLEVMDLEVIDLTESVRGAGGEPLPDLRTFEERYATLAFGLGTVPRRQHFDEPLWQRPAGALVAVSAVLAFLTLVSSVR